MLPSPSSSPQGPPHVLDPITNLAHIPQPQLLRQTSLKFFPTPPHEKKPKRQATLTGFGPNKPTIESSSDEEDWEPSDDEEDVFVAGPSTRPAHYGARAAQTYNRPTYLSIYASTSTLPVLQSFVSSHKADVFKCLSVQPDRHLTPPYACAYSHGARNGRTPYLAVAHEEGTVHIFNTSKRRDWDEEPQRQTITNHSNGVFDVQWDNSDSRIVTCSGDKSALITDVRTGQCTHGLAPQGSTVKCVAWDPNHQDLLATGSRDGSIHLFDLRVHEEWDDGLKMSNPVRAIPGAHQDLPKGKGRAKKGTPAAPGITSLLSASADGILKFWDLRCLTSGKKSRRRPRGILSLAAGRGPTAGYIFGLGADSQIHCYTLPSLTPDTSRRYTHPNLVSSGSFYVSISVSPCGRWLASGANSKDGKAFIFDVATRPSEINHASRGVQLNGQVGEVGAVDWAEDALATCADDGTVRVWRPDVVVYRSCVQQPEETRWDWAWAS
ncbi:WD40 repeat-like protein [Coprinellus micaceus]|uniref:WD40 repeat-like protein n=1 Tax=Coprinellus micaceus TaxID=71717 RepID=A0A4Y7TME3_COPMI|nr:WD40 repeat-like protein [Coprinellus micaceus]